MSPTPSACELQVLDQRIARDSDTSPNPDAPELPRADELVGYAAANPQHLSGFPYGQCQGKVIEVGDGAVVCAVVVVIHDVLLTRIFAIFLLMCGVRDLLQ